MYFMASKSERLIDLANSKACFQHAMYMQSPHHPVNTLPIPYHCIKDLLTALNNLTVTANLAKSTYYLDAVFKALPTFPKYKG